MLAPQVATGKVHQTRSLPAVFPPGIGILLVGADTTLVRKNIVTGNQFVGVGVASLCLPLSLLGQPCDGLDVDPQPDANRITGNVARGNGTESVPDPALDAFRADVSWDGSGNANCWKANTFATSVPPQFPACSDSRGFAPDRNEPRS